jgi:hypothetical protein
MYRIAYNLPPLSVSDKDWDIFFDTIYDMFTNKGIEKEFYNHLSVISRITFAKALVNKTKAVRINDFINNLYYLQGKYRMSDCDISKKEILNI